MFKYHRAVSLLNWTTLILNIYSRSASMNFVGSVWSHGRNITRLLAVISGQRTIMTMLSILFKARVGVLYQMYNARRKPSVLYLIKHDCTASALNGLIKRPMFKSLLAK